MAETFADKITGMFAPNDPDMRKITKQFSRSAERIPALKKWLGDRAKNPRSVGGVEKWKTRRSAGVRRLPDS